MMSRASFAIVASSILLVACDANPGVALGTVGTEGKLRLYLHGIPKLAKVSVCDQEVADASDVEVPLGCVLPDDMTLDVVNMKDVKTKPIPIVVKPLVGSPKRVEKTLTIKTTDQIKLIEGALATVTRGEPLGNGGEPDGTTGIALMGYGGVRAIGAKTLKDVDIVVRIKLVNPRETGRTCGYEGAVSGKLKAYEADLEAFDAHTGKSIGKTHLENETPTCPSSNYAAAGETNTVTSRPPDREIDAWAKTLSR